MGNIFHSKLHIIPTIELSVDLEIATEIAKEKAQVHVICIRKKIRKISNPLSDRCTFTLCLYAIRALNIQRPKRRDTYKHFFFMYVYVYLKSTIYIRNCSTHLMA